MTGTRPPAGGGRFWGEKSPLAATFQAEREACEKAPSPTPALDQTLGRCSQAVLFQHPASPRLPSVNLSPLPAQLICPAPMGAWN